MKQYFPNRMHTDFKSNFQEYFIDKICDIISDKIYIFILKRDSEDEYFDLDCLLQYNLSPMERKTILDKLITSLNNLNWKTGLCFSDTGLFIYSDITPYMLANSVNL